MLTETQIQESLQKFKVAVKRANEIIMFSPSVINELSIPLSEKDKKLAIESFEFTACLFTIVAKHVEEISASKVCRILSTKEGDEMADGVVLFVSEKLLSFGSTNNYNATREDANDMLLIISEYNMYVAEMQLKNHLDARQG